MVVPFLRRCDTLGCSGGALNPKVPLFRHICGSLEGTRHWPISSSISPEVQSKGALDTLVCIFEYVTDWLFHGPLSVNFLRFLDVSKSCSNSGALDIQNFDPKICMKVPMYLTRFSENSKKFHVHCSLSYGRSSKWPLGGRNISRPFAAWRVDNFHAMSFGNCRGPF